MRGDLFLGLLAYNIGPQNGGLRSIMDKYGAKDFVTIQPYLKTLGIETPAKAQGGPSKESDSGAAKRPKS